MIYSTVRPYLRNVAIVRTKFTPKAIASTAFAVLHPTSSISSEYLFLCLRSDYFKIFVESKQKGVAYPAINGADLKLALIPVPPLDEQELIVKRVTALNDLCDDLEKQIRCQLDLAEKFAKSVVSTSA